MRLCAVSSITESCAREFDINDYSLFAVKKRGIIYIYRNRCPHLHVPLNWEPDKFLNNTGELIQCSTHGAVFDISNGECLQGPCLGQSLKRINYKIKGADIYIEESELKP